MKRFVFRGTLDAENIDHAMLTLAFHLVNAVVELSDEEPGIVLELKVEPDDGAAA